MRQKDIYIANLEPSEGVVIACPISSKIKNFSSCVTLGKNKINNLDQDSEIITFQIRTISKKRLKKKIGEISENELKEIFKGLSEVLIY